MLLRDTAMTEETKKTTGRSEIGGLFSALPQEIRWVIACLLAYFVFIGGFMALGKLPTMLENKCWELQVKEGRVFKLNACTGQVIELSAEDLKAKK